MMLLYVSYPTDLTERRILHRQPQCPVPPPSIGYLKVQAAPSGEARYPASTFVIPDEVGDIYPPTSTLSEA